MDILPLIQERNIIQEKLEKINRKISQETLSDADSIQQLGIKESLTMDLKMIMFQLEGNVPIDLEQEILKIRARLFSLKKTNTWLGSMTDLEHLINSIELPRQWGIEGLRAYNGKPITIGAFSGVGKSTFLINLIYYYLSINKKILVFSNEMTKGEYITKLIQFESLVKAGKGLKFFDILKNKNEFDFLRQRWEKNLIIYDENMSASQIDAHVEILKNDIGIEMVFIDYLQNIEPENPYKLQTQKEAIDQSVRILTNSARRNKIPFIQAAQTNRSSKKDGVNDHSSFEGSGNIEKNSALCMILTPDENPGFLVGNVSKNRFGKTGKIRFRLDETTRYILGGEKIE